MKTEIIKGTGIQGINVSFTLQEMIVMKDFAIVMKDFATRMQDVIDHPGPDLELIIYQGINFFEKLLGETNISGLSDAHVSLFGERRAENEL